jgi:methionyl-tRNA formyltransferase
MVMRMDEGLDTGPICLGERIPIPPTMTAGELHDIMAAAGASLMARALAALERGSLVCTPQPAEGITYAAKISKAEARINFNRPAREVVDHIRGLSPFPGAYFELTAGGKRERIKVLAAEAAEGVGKPGRTLDDRLAIACAAGAIRVLRLQRAGRQAMSAEQALLGLKVPAGTLLGG